MGTLFCMSVGSEKTLCECLIKADLSWCPRLPCAWCFLILMDMNAAGLLYVSSHSEGMLVFCVKWCLNLDVSGLSLADDLLELVRCMADVWKGDGSLELRTFVYLCDEEWLRLAAGIEGLLFSRWVVVMSWCDEVPASSCLVQLIL